MPPLTGISVKYTIHLHDSDLPYNNWPLQIKKKKKLGYHFMHHPVVSWCKHQYVTKQKVATEQDTVRSTANCCIVSLIHITEKLQDAINN
jgi:hypothetical protein